MLPPGTVLAPRERGGTWNEEAPTLGLVLLFAVASATGLLFSRLGVPGGLITGAMIGGAAVNLLRGGSGLDVPHGVQSAALLVLGAGIGATVTRDTLTSLRAALLPAVLAAVLIIAAGIGIALLLRALGIAPAGDVLATSPGALSALTAAAADRGTGAAEVALFHTVRVVLVLLSLPALYGLLPGDRG